MRRIALFALLALTACGGGSPAPANADMSSSAAPDLSTAPTPDLQSIDLAGCRLEGQSCTGFALGNCCPIADVMCMGGRCLSTLP
jgi:hypothetical protein